MALLSQIAFHQPTLDGLPCLLGDLELDRLIGLLMDDMSPRAYLLALSYVGYLELYEVTCPKLAINR